MGKLIHRVGTQDVPKFGGIRLDCDPGALPANRFRRLINARISAAPGGPIKSRGGQSKYGQQALGCIRGIFSPEYDFSTLQPCGPCPETWEGGLEEMTADSLILGSERSATTSIAGVVAYFNDVQEPRLRTIVPQPWGGVQGGIPYAVYSPDGVTCYVLVMTTTDVVLYKFTRLTATEEVARMTDAHSLGAGIYMSRLHLNGTDLYAVGSNHLGVLGTYNRRTWRVVGNTFVLDEDVVLDTTDGTSNAIGSIGADVYTAGDGTNFILPFAQYRRKHAGVWSDLTVPGGANFLSPLTSDFVLYGGKLYICGSASGSLRPSQIHSISGTTVTVEVTGASSPYDEIGPMATFDGFLWYVYYVAATARLNLGRYNGVTWDNTYLDITDDYPIVGTGIPGSVIAMRAFGGKLRLFVSTNASDPSQCKYNILSSQGNDLTLPLLAENARNNLGAVHARPAQTLTELS